MKKDVNGGNGLLLVDGLECINTPHIISDIDVTLGITLLRLADHSRFEILMLRLLKRGEANIANNYIELYVGSHIKKALDITNRKVL